MESLEKTFPVECDHCYPEPYAQSVVAQLEWNAAMEVVVSEHGVHALDELFEKYWRSNKTLRVGVGEAIRKILEGPAGDMGSGLLVANKREATPECVIEWQAFWHLHRSRLLQRARVR